MANTYTALANNVTMPTSAAIKTVFAIYNADDVRKLNITRVWMLNANTVANAGVFQVMTLGRHTTIQTTGATTITPVLHDTNNAALNANVTVNHSPTSATVFANNNQIRTFAFSGDEFAVGTSKVENLMAMPSFGLIFDAAYGDTTIQPIVLNQNEGLSLNASGIASGRGVVDVIVEFYVS